MKALFVLLVTLAIGASAWGQEKIALEIASINNDQQALDAVIAAYEELHPNVDVTTYYAPIDQYNVVLRTQLASGTGPDVLYVFAGSEGNPMTVGSLANQGHLAPLTEQDWVASIPAGDRQLVMHGGNTYVLPLNKLVVGLFYNKQIFQDLGLEPPQTWDGLLAACETLKGAGYVPLALGNQTPWVTQLVAFSIAASTVYAENPEFDLEVGSSANFADSQGWKEALQKYLELEQQGCFNEFPNGTSYEATVQMVATGEAAMAVQTSGLLIQVERYGMPEEQLGLVAFPGTNDPARNAIFAAVLSSYGVNANSDEPEVAADFVQFLARPDIMNLYLSGRVPAIPLQGIEISPIFDQMLTLVGEGKSAPVGVMWPNPRVQEVMLRGIQELFAGDTTVDELLAEMDEAAGEN